MFANPLILFALPLAGLPIIFHLMMRRKRKQIQFPTFMFFLRADPRMHSRRKLRELLLLLCRVLLLLFLILALSRPVIRMFKGQTSNLAVAIVIDNSASMTGAGNEKFTKLHLATEGARDLIKQLDNESQASLVLMVDDPSVGLADEGSTVSKAELLQATSRIRATDGTGNLGVALNRALRNLRGPAEDQDKGLVIHVFSDLQSPEWDVSQIDLPDIGREVDLFVHRVETMSTSGANAVIQNVILPKEQILPNHSYPIDVILRNDSSANLSIRLNHEDSQKQTGSEDLVLEPLATSAVRLHYKPLTEGAQWVNVWIEGDEFEADNRASVGFICRPKANLIFGGEREEFGLLPQLISPAGDGSFSSLVPQFVPPQRVLDQLDELEPIMVVLTWQGMAAFAEQANAEALERYVKAGGNLLVLPAPFGGLGASNYPKWLGAKPESLENPVEQATILVLNRRHPVWDTLRNELGDLPFRYFLARRYCPLKVQPRDNLILGLSAAQPLFAQRQIGAGNLYMSGFSFASEWTDIATDPSGVGLVLSHSMAIGILNNNRQSIALVAGDPTPPLFVEDEEVEVVSLVGDALRMKASPQNLPSFPRSGVYMVNAKDKRYSVSVRASGREGTTNYLNDNKLACLGDIDYSVDGISDPENFGARLASRSTGFPLFLPLLFLAGLVWLFEAWLCSGSGSSARGGGAKLSEEELVLQGPQQTKS